VRQSRVGQHRDENLCLRGSSACCLRRSDQHSTCLFSELKGCLFGVARIARHQLSTHMLSTSIIEEFRALRKINSLNGSRQGGHTPRYTRVLATGLSNPSEPATLPQALLSFVDARRQHAQLACIQPLKNFACPSARKGTEQPPPPSQYTTPHTGKWAPALPYSHH
jgi:hypothetical protein